MSDSWSQWLASSRQSYAAEDWLDSRPLAICDKENLEKMDAVLLRANGGKMPVREKPCPDRYPGFAKLHIENP